MPVVQKNYDDSQEPEFRTVEEEAYKRQNSISLIYQKIKSKEIKCLKVGSEFGATKFLYLIPVNQSLNLSEVTYITPYQLARFLKIPVATVMNWIRRNLIPYKAYQASFRQRKIYVIPWSDFKQWYFLKKGINLDATDP